MSAAKHSGLLDALAARWAALASRERVLVGSAVALIAAALLWWVAIAPALASLRQASAAAPALDAQLQLMRAQAVEATTLRAQRSLSYDESLRSLEAAVKALGASATLSVSDARASITLRGASGDALAQMLAQVRANARLVPSELRLKQTTPSAAPSAAPSTAPSTAPSNTPPAAANSNPAPAATLWDGTIMLGLPSR